MRQYKLGLVSVSFRKTPPEEILKAMKEAGLSCIEWGSDVHAPCDDRKRLEELVRLQKEYDINCCSYGTYFRIGTSPLKELDKYITAAKLLETDIVRLWCGNKNSEDYADGEKEALFAACQAAEKIAKPRGVKICIECHNGTFTNTKESSLELMKTVNSDHFCMYWQPNQFRTAKENIEYATLLSKYTEHIHVFNWEGKTHYPLIDAVSVWKEYLKCFSGGRTLLLEFMPDNRIESLPTEAKALYQIAEVNI